MQLIIVILVLITAVAYIGWRTYKTLTGKSGRCTGCPLSEVCKKRDVGEPY